MATLLNLLPPRQAHFCREYVLDHVGKRAAIAAGYSAKRADQQASRLLSDGKVAAAIDALEAARADRLDLKVDDVIRELMRIAFVDIRSIYNEAGEIRPMADWPLDAARAVSEIQHDVLTTSSGDRETTTVRSKLKLASKLHALELLGKRLKLWVERHQLEEPAGKPAKGWVLRMPARDYSKLPPEARR